MGLGAINLAPLQTEIRVRLDGFRTQMEQVVSTATRAAQQTSERLASINKVGEKLTSVGTTMTTHVTAPIVALGTACSKVALDAESSFAKVNTIIDQSVVGTDELKEKVVAASNESGVAVTDFNEALYQSISAGVDSGNAIEFTTEMAKLAKGGFTSTESAVNVVTTALNAYGLSADQATSISDKLITTQNLGKTSVDELASSLGKVIPTANAYGVNIDNVSATMADLTKNGIATAEATTYYNSMLNELGASGTKASTVIKEKLGASFKELMDQGTPLTEVLKALKDKATESGMSLGDMFGSAEAAKAALTIMKDDGVEYNDILNQMQNSAGATQKAFETMDASPMEKIKKAMNEVKNAGIQFGTILIPVITNVAGAIRSFADRVQSLSKGQQEFIVKAAGVAAAIGPILVIVGTVITKIVSMSAAWSAASAAMAAAGISLSAIAAPIALVIAGVAALAVAIATDFGGIRECISSVMQSISEIITVIWTTITNIWNNDLNGIRTITTDVFNIMQTIFSTAFNIISSLFQAFSAAFQGDWSGCWTAVQNIVNTIWEAIKSLVGQALNLIVDIILGMAAAILDAALTAFNAAKDGASQAWEALKSWFSSAVNDPVGTLKGIGSALREAGASAFRNILDGFKSVWSSITSWVSEKINWIKEKVNVFNSAKNSMSDSGSDGSHYNGLSYVPFDGYNARLHKGERVLTADENKAYNAGRLSGGNNGGITLNIENFNNNRKSDVKQLAEELEFYRKK